MFIEKSKSPSKTVVVHQPDYLPYLGFFDRLIHADTLIILDHVLISKRGWVHRDKIIAPTGEKWITIPIKNIKTPQAINNVQIDINNKLYQKTLRLIQASYFKAPYFKEIYCKIEEAHTKKHTFLVDLNIELLSIVMGLLDLKVKIFRSSQLGVNGVKSELVSALVQKLGGEIYLSGTGAMKYHNDAYFTKADIKVVWQNFKHPTYPQLSKQFLPGMSCVDLLFNCGIEQSRNILRTNSRIPQDNLEKNHREL